MKKIRTLFFAAAFAALFVPAFAQQNEEVFNSKSAVMNAEIPAYVILPDSYAASPKRTYPTVYLLHGYGGNYTVWLKRTKPDLQKLASAFDTIIVCPEGAASWYWDAPKNPASKFETYITTELVPQIDAKYRTVKSPSARAISGFSMGGHGALWLAFRHRKIFGACGALSGGVDIRPFSDNWKMIESLGELADNKDVWDSHTVINLIYTLPRDGSFAIYIDCGVNDFFYQVNEEFHKQLLYNRVPHDYITRPGAHNHEYWNNAIDYQMLFFKKFFARSGL